MKNLSTIQQNSKDKLFANQQPIYKYILFTILILLSFATIKLGGTLRVSQILLILTAFLFFIIDFTDRKNDYNLLLFLFFGAVGMSLVSLNSSYEKFGEIKFIIKYFLIFPATFYVGAKMVQKVGIKNLAPIFEIVAFIYAFMAYIIYFSILPQNIIDLIVHYREGFGGIKYLDFQGTFFEAGWFAFATSALLMAAFFIRYEFNIWPKNRVFLYLIYGFVFIALIFSKNKTIWIAFIAILFILSIIKVIMLLFYSNYYQPSYIIYKNYTLNRLKKINPFKIFIILILIIAFLAIINDLLKEPLISMEMINEKLQEERGKAFITIMQLLKESNWLGGYGFGFVEYYFSTMPITIMGLGEGSGMVFNSYLDIWLSVSFIGLLFHLILLGISIKTQYFFTLALPLFCFIFANFNPAIGDEYYYLLLGLSYGIIQKYIKKNPAYA